MGSGRDVCDECRLEYNAEQALRIQREYDVNLGWSSHDPRQDRERFGFRDPVVATIRW